MGVHGILESLNWMRDDIGYNWTRDFEDYPRDRNDFSPEQQAAYREKEAAAWERHELEYGMLNDEYSLEEDLFHAIREGDTVTLQYLLEQGTDANMLNSLQRWGAFGQACILGQLECAKLLREYGAFLILDYDQEEVPDEPSRELLQEVEEGGEVWEWLHSRPVMGRCRNERLEWWPTPPAPQPPASWAALFHTPPGVKPFVVEDVKRWHAAKRAYYRQPMLRRWARVRSLVAARAIVLYWQERTQVKLCAPGGDGRASDRAAYEVDNGKVVLEAHDLRHTINEIREREAWSEC